MIENVKFKDLRPDVVWSKLSLTDTSLDVYKKFQETIRSLAKPEKVQGYPEQEQVYPLEYDLLHWSATSDSSNSDV